MLLISGPLRKDRSLVHLRLRPRCIKVIAPQDNESENGSEDDRRDRSEDRITERDERVEGSDHDAQQPHRGEDTVRRTTEGEQRPEQQLVDSDERDVHGGCLDGEQISEREHGEEPLEILAHLGQPVTLLLRVEGD